MFRWLLRHPVRRSWRERGTMFKHIWRSGFALAFVALIVVACDNAPPASTIETIVVDVSRAAPGGSWVSVPLAARLPLNNGDSVSTSPQGEGLIQLPCAWLRVYRNSLLQVEQVSVSGADLVAALGASLVKTDCAKITVQNGSNPPEALIETQGTLFFFAFNAQRHIALLWTLDGTASLANLRLDRSTGVTVLVPSGRWSVVRNAGVPEVARPESEIGPILDEMNLRDVYERVLRELGRVVPTPTPTPTATAMPQSMVCRPGVLFCEDFERALAAGWRLDPGWQLMAEGTNHVLGGKGHAWAMLTGQVWPEVRLRFRVRLEQGIVHLNYLLREVPGGLDRYFIGFGAETLYLARQRGADFMELASMPARHTLGSWYIVEIVSWNGRIIVYVNGYPELDYTDKAPLMLGGIAFETLDNSSAQIDDIEVMPAGATPVPLATIAPTATATLTHTPTRPSTITPTRTWTPTRTQTPLPPGTLSGRVTSGAQGIPYAQVTIIPCSGDICLALSARSVSTNSYGYYTFSNVGSGTYSVDVSASGYIKQNKTAHVSSGQTTTLDFALVKSLTGSGTGVVLAGSATCFDFDQGVKSSVGIDYPYACPSQADIKWSGSVINAINGAGMGYPNPQTNSYEACGSGSPLIGGVTPTPGKYYCVFTQQDRTAVIRISSVTSYPSYSVTFDWWRY